jgi:PadR family transcriptional regulator, regulatory protein AphA
LAELRNTARVILGLLRLMGERTGYELKAAIDDSTEFFWAASYGRIYPELRRLEEEGLIAGREAPRGERPRKLYALTPAGERALERWLTSGNGLIYEVRDEGLLKFFFADAMPREEAIANLREMRAHHERIIARLRELEPFARSVAPNRFPLLTLEGGIELHTWYAEWCRKMERRIKRREARVESDQP